jgi:hypothetical protein
MRLLAAMALVFGLVAATPAQLDSQMVLQRYELEMADLASPSAMIFSYAVSQAGPTNIEQRHTVYREGLDVRDEMLAVNGQPLKRKIVRIGRRENRYTLAKLAPRIADYSLIFLKTVRNGSHLDYEYEASPIALNTGGFAIEGVTIDGERFLPRTITFATTGANARAKGEVQFAASGKYWVPVVISVDATINGKPARERIVWSDYRFPAHLPPSTFVGPKPLPHATLPPL